MVICIGIEEFTSIETLEFDGTTVLCRVCGDKASGFHYGVHSCEGCKGFFRRSIQQKIQYRPCSKNQQCAIQRINRNRCQYCRLKKCIAVGMSRDAVRFGRVPKREKAKILAAMQSCNSQRSQDKVAAELEDDQRLVATIINAHMETCDFTREKISPLLMRVREHPVYVTCPQTVACPLNPPTVQPVAGQQQMVENFSQRFSPAIRGVVDFAKMLPGFSVLSQDDQVTLLKAGVFEVLLVRLAAMFDAQTNTMVCLNGQVMKRESLQNSTNTRFLMDSMFEFADRLNALRLDDKEVALFSAVVVIAPDRPGLRNVDLIAKMQTKMKLALQQVLQQRHLDQPGLYSELMQKIHDLRTLNTLHSDKLVAYKMTEQRQQQQQRGWFMPQEEELVDREHSPIHSVSSSESVLCGLGVKRQRDNSHSDNSSDECSSEPSPAKCPYKAVKLDSPPDSGIDSSNEKMSTSSSTSVCSSPRSSHEDDVAPADGGETSLLKRALQAPPLANSHLLDDFPYTAHKKFDALRKVAAVVPRDSADSGACVKQESSSSFGGSILAKTLMEGPKISPEQMKKRDLVAKYIVCGSGRTSPQPHASSPFPPLLSPTHTPSPRPTPSPHYIPHPSPSPQRSSPNMLELQLGLTDSQPLNLSKKSPPPPHKIPLEV